MIWRLRFVHCVAVRTSLVAVRLVVEHREASNGCSGLRWPFPDQAC
jgi:hypothetical protein